MFKRGFQLAPQFPVSEPNDFAGVTSTRHTFGSVGLTSSVNNAPDEAQPEQFISKLLASPGSEQKSELVLAYFQNKEAIETYLEETRAARLADLVERHNASVAEARRTSKAMTLAQEAEFSAQNVWVGLDEKATNARNELATGQHKLGTMDRSLVTIAERRSLLAHIETLKAKAVKTADAEGVALNRYHKLLAESGEAVRVHMSAVSVAAELSSQIDAL
jgi:hypothetical protein